MATRSDVRVTIDVPDGPRLLLSITERRTGDLVIPIRAARSYRPDPRSDEIGPDILFQKYSVHASDDSATGINKIKHTLRLATETLYSRHFTKAIKTNNTFAPLFIKQTGPLHDARYSATPSRAKVVSLGNFDPREFTLVFGVFASRADREFRSRPDDSFNATQIQFARFRLLVLWSFLSLPSHPSTQLTHALTRAPDEPQTEEARHVSELLAEGLSDREVAEFFYARREIQRRNFVSLIRPTLDTPEQIALVDNSWFFRDPSLDGPEYRDYRAALTLAGRLP